MSPLPWLLSLLTSAAVLHAEPIAIVGAGSPLAAVAARIEVTVGREMSMVSSKYYYQYLEKDDPDHSAHLLLAYPLYVEPGLKTLDDIISASALRLQVEDQPIAPREAELVPPGFLSGYPVPEDAQVALVTFDIPRSVARVRFPVTITHLQPNYHYHGALLAAFTPWLPKMIRAASGYALEDHEWEVSLHALNGVTLKQLAAPGKILADTAAELTAVPEHGKTLAAEILPAATTPPP